MGVSWVGKVSNIGIDNKRGESQTHLSRYMHKILIIKQLYE